MANNFYLGHLFYFRPSDEIALAMVRSFDYMKIFNDDHENCLIGRINMNMNMSMNMNMNMPWRMRLRTLAR